VPKGRGRAGAADPPPPPPAKRFLASPLAWGVWGGCAPPFRGDRGGRSPPCSYLSFFITLVERRRRRREVLLLCDRKRGCYRKAIPADFN